MQHFGSGSQSSIHFASVEVKENIKYEYLIFFLSSNGKRQFVLSTVCTYFELFFFLYYTFHTIKVCKQGVICDIS